MSESDQPQVVANVARRRTIRSGVVILSVGVGLALVAAFVLGQGNSSMESLFSGVHRFGMFVMLVGFVTIFLGARQSTNLSRRRTKE